MNTQIIELTKKYRELEDQAETVGAELKEINAEWAEVEATLLQALIDEGVNSAAIDGVGKVTMKAKNYLSVTIANKPEFFDYLRETNNDSILKLDVHAGTLGAFLDTHLAELMAKFQEQGSDMIESREKALEILNNRGVSYFTKRTLTFKKEK